MICDVCAAALLICDALFVGSVSRALADPKAFGKSSLTINAVF